MNLQVTEQDKDTSTRCTLCNKHFGTKNAFENHLQSKKHKETESKQAEQTQAQVQKRIERNEVKGINVLQENQKFLKKDSVNMALKEQLQSSSKQGISAQVGDQAGAAGSSGSSPQGSMVNKQGSSGTQYRNNPAIQPLSDDEGNYKVLCSVAPKSHWHSIAGHVMLQLQHDLPGNANTTDFSQALLVLESKLFLQGF